MLILADVAVTAVAVNNTLRAATADRIGFGYKTRKAVANGVEITVHFTSRTGTAGTRVARVRRRLRFGRRSRHGRRVAEASVRAAVVTTVAVSRAVNVRQARRPTRGFSATFALIRIQRKDVRAFGASSGHRVVMMMRLFLQYGVNWITRL